MEKNFWKTKKLNEFTDEEWEAVCDGCGKCCLYKVGFFKIRFSCVACKLLDIKTGRCSNYGQRHDFVPECLKLTPDNLKKTRKFLPKTCAYLWLLKKKGLPPWHYLVSGNKNSIHMMGLSVKDRAISEATGAKAEEHLIRWDDI